ncbi:FadR/GntR family transcriptional regulator [Undibacter mobilis]|uniref:FadR/GntR family transcriptional regulator n=1 Tax=Undibacter mobilis TaxID=2292256 RepID=UPI003D31B646
MNRSPSAIAASGSGWSEAKRSALIYQRIFELIVSGDFPVNARLPSETDLATRFGASRPVVREALARLRDDGVIVSRQGSGSYVKRRPDVAVLKLSPGGSIDDIQRCFEFRHGLEGSAAALAAERWEDADLKEIRAAFAALEQAIKNVELGAEADERFHTAVARATHNPYYVSMQTSMQPHIRYGMNVNRNLSMLRPAERVRLVQDEHRAILKAIEARDPEAASDAMQHHIANARRRMFEGVTE